MTPEARPGAVPKARVTAMTRAGASKAILMTTCSPKPKERAKAMPITMLQARATARPQARVIVKLLAAVLEASRTAGPKTTLETVVTIKGKAKGKTMLTSSHE